VICRILTPTRVKPNRTGYCSQWNEPVGARVFGSGENPFGSTAGTWTPASSASTSQQFPPQHFLFSLRLPRWTSKMSFELPVLCTRACATRRGPGQSERPWPIPPGCPMLCEVRSPGPVGAAGRHGGWAGIPDRSVPSAATWRRGSDHGLRTLPDRLRWIRCRLESDRIRPP
jgi:hypothetical protein